MQHAVRQPGPQGFAKSFCVKLVRGRASIAIADGTLALQNHDGTPASVELLFPRETDALEAGREAAAVASVKGGSGSC